MCIADFLSRSDVKTEEPIDKTIQYMVQCVGGSRVNLSKKLKVMKFWVKF